MLAAILAAIVGGGCEDGTPAGPVDPPTGRTTYSIRYTVKIPDRDPKLAFVRWELAGIDEIRRFRFELRDDRLFDFRGTGSIVKKDDEIVWVPDAPYASLRYKVRLRHRRSNESGYDSYSGEDWVITRAQDLFPATHVTFETDIEPEPRSRSSLVFRVPRGWESFTAMSRLSPHHFRPSVPGKRLDRPKGWIALGKMEVDRRQIGPTAVTVARPPTSDLDTGGLLDLYEKVLPIFGQLFGSRPDRLLVVSGPDPMWRGALSGEHSIFIHGNRPLRSRDQTSTPIHELFHVLAPFRPGSDAYWVTEGLAEYYSLELQRRVGALDEKRFAKGLVSFAESGDWNRNLTRDRSLAVVNNSAPLVVAIVDRRIRERSKGERTLDDVVRKLAKQDGPVSTASFLRSVNQVSGLNFTPFFQAHVYAGRKPDVPG